MDMLLPPYQYSSLDADTEIRVLKLKPATDFAAPLVASLFMRRLEDDPESPGPAYECVSYCWGTLEDLQWLECDKQRLRITANVDSMLRHLRKPTKERILWIDALCINQADNQEKGKQVQSMGAIYAYANKVHVWLGTAEEEDHIPSIFALLKEEALYRRSSGQFSELGQKLMAPVSESLRYSVTSFLSRPWFLRRWILQEVALAHVVTVHCGHQKLSWNCVQPGLHLLRLGFGSDKFSNPTGLPYTEAAYAIETMELLKPMSSFAGKSIIDLLWTFHSSRCVDERDRLFSLYGILSTNLSRDVPNPRVHCPVDYSKNWVSLYIDFATSLAEGGFSHELLRHTVAFGTLSQQNPRWPSWVPSWNMQRKWKFLREDFDDAGGTQGKWGYPAELVSIQQQPGLRIQGLFGGELPTIGETVDNMSPSLDIFSRCQLLLKQITRAKNGTNSEYLLEERRLASLLATGFDFAQNRYDCSEFKWASLFKNKDDLERMMNHYNKMRDITSALMAQELGTADTLGLKEILGLVERTKYRQTVNAVMHNCTPFYSQTEEGTVLGISFADYQPGDIIFSPRNMNVGDMELIVRPLQQLYATKDSKSPVYRLVGSCLLNLPGEALLIKRIKHPRFKSWEEAVVTLV